MKKTLNQSVFNLVANLPLSSVQMLISKKQLVHLATYGITVVKVVFLLQGVLFMNQSMINLFKNVLNSQIQLFMEIPWIKRPIKDQLSVKYSLIKFYGIFRKE